VPTVGRRFGDQSADNETFKCFALPYSRLADLLCKIPDLLDGVEYSGLGLDEAPLVCELVDNVRGLSAEIFCVFVDAVEMKPRFFRRVWEDVFLEIVVTQLAQNRLVRSTRQLRLNKPLPPQSNSFPKASRQAAR
jgi:hypothetical protein